MKMKNALLVILISSGLLFMLYSGLSIARSSAIITVNGTGDIIADDGICILREAVANANQDDQSGSTDCTAGDGDDTIQFNLPAGSVISVTNQAGVDEITIADSLTIIGLGSDQLAISQDETHSKRLFAVEPNVNFTISDVTLRDIHALSTGQHGAVIHNDGGNVTVQRVHFINNRTNNSGGAIFSEDDGFLTVLESEFRHNAVLAANGGALDINNPALIQNSLFYSNTASNGGGAIDIGITSIVTIENSVFSQNQTWNDGGAISNHAMNLSISHSTFEGNICTDCEGGAIDNRGFLTLVNSTLSGNSARTGGAINTNVGDASVYPLTIIHSTIVDNHSNPDAGGGLYIRRSLSSLLNVQMFGSIVANNSGGNDCDYLDWNGTITSNGYNMVESGCTDFFSEPTDLPGVDPMLATLQNNGGLSAPLVPPSTHALQVGSQAINLSNCNGVALDQRYAPRPVGAGCDVGAYEMDGMPPTPTPTPTPSTTFVYLPITIKSSP